MSLTLTRRGAVGVLTLDRPDKRNALNAALWAAIPERIAEAVADDGIRAVVLAGAGDHFAAGADFEEIEALAGDDAAAERFLEAMNRATAAIADAPKPVIAALKGACIGAGLALAAACDLRLAVANARFAAPPAQLGIAYPHADTARLVSLIGPAAAKRLFLTAETIDAGEALRMGLIDRMVETPVEESAIVQAEAIAKLSPASHAAMLEMIDAIAAGAQAETPRTRALFLNAFDGDAFRAGLDWARAERAEARRRREG